MGKVAFRKVSLFGLVALLALFSTAFAAESGYVVGLGSYPLRGNPQFSSPSIGRVRVGERVNIVERGSGWVRIEVGEKTGWVLESIVGRKPPAALQLGPLRARLKDLEVNLGEQLEENEVLREDSARLAERVAVLEKDLKKSQKIVAESRSYQRLWGIALGGGLVIFGWIAGYSLAALSRRRGSKRKYHLE